MAINSCIDAKILFLKTNRLFQLIIHPSLRSQFKLTQILHQFYLFKNDFHLLLYLKVFYILLYNST
jgi:hypothetical protein